MAEQKFILDISIKTILKFFMVLISLAILYLIKDVILLFLFVVIFFSVLNPIVNKWESEMSRGAAVLALFSIILLFIIAAGLLIFPPLLQQIQLFISEAPNYLKNLIPSLDISALENAKNSFFSLSGAITKFGSAVFNTTIGFFGGVVAIFTVIVSTYYLLMEKNKVRSFIKKLPIKNKAVYFEMFEKISEKMGSWMRGQLTIMIIIAILDIIGLTIFKIPFALALGIWGGLAEIIPYAGSFLGIIPGILIAISTHNTFTIIGVIVMYLLIQQLQAHVINPKVMGKAVGLSPVVIIFAILIGAKLLGIIGVVLAVPIAAALSVFVQEYHSLIAEND